MVQYMMMIGYTIWNITLYEFIESNDIRKPKEEYSKKKMFKRMLTCSIPKFSLSSAADDSSFSKAICRRRRSNLSLTDIWGADVDLMVFVVAVVAVSCTKPAGVTSVVEVLILFSKVKIIIFDSDF